MPPRNNSGSLKKTRRPPAKSPQQASGIKKPIGARRSTRLQAQASPNPPTPRVSQPQRRVKRKRPHGSETDEPKNAPLTKQPRTRPSPLAELSVKNLRKFSKEMGSASGKRTKLTSPRRSKTASADIPLETVSIQPPRPSSSTAHYRYFHLAAVNIHIHDSPPPADIQARIDAVIKAEVPQKRQTKLLALSQGFYTGCDDVVTSAVGQVDCIQLLQTAFKAMNHSKLRFRSNADWRVELKPTIPQDDYNHNLNILDSYQQEVNDALARPTKRRKQQTDPTYISPEPSKADISYDTPDNKALDSDIMPPAGPSSLPDNKTVSSDTMPPPGPDNSHIKTPRPDITIGLEDSALISALSLQNLNNSDNASNFLKFLQTPMVYRENGLEPTVCSVPTQRDPNLVFPFAVIEGKTYSSGETIFETQNQAAVSGTCGLKILVCLDELVDKVRTDSVSNPIPPFLFSICTEGPLLQLWAHYTIIEEGERKFFMVLLKTYNGVLLEDVVDFLTVLDNVLRWGTGEFLDGIVERLGIAARNLGA